MDSKKGRLAILFFAAVSCICLFCACPSEPQPEPGEFEVTLSLSPDSPQTTVIVSWEASENAESYSIERQSERDGVVQTRLFEWNKDKGLSITDNTCEPDCTYTYTVTATLYYSGFMMLEESSRQAPEKSITTQKDPLLTLDSPKNVKVEASATVPKTLTVKWDAVQNAAAYQVYINKRNSFENDEDYEKVAETAQTSYTIEHLTEESRCSFMIKAINGENYSLLSVKANGTVPKAKNITMDKAYMLTNALEEEFRSEADSLWFKCTPEQGKISFKGFNEYNNKTSSLTIFNSDGTVAATGLSMYVNPENQNEQMSIIKDEEGAYEGVQLNLNTVIHSFAPGNTYYLRITKEYFYYLNIKICVE